MRIKTETADYFVGSHKGGSIEIDREPDGRFFIQVRWKHGGYMYNGWAPDDVTTMADAKREAIKGAGL